MGTGVRVVAVDRQLRLRIERDGQTHEAVLSPAAIELFCHILAGRPPAPPCPPTVAKATD
jgi:hypothetical protein